MRKYRYILTGGVKPSDPISDYRLLAPQIITKQFHGCDNVASSAIRVDVTDIELEKWACDDYSTTGDNTHIANLNPKVFLMKNWKWREEKDLTEKWLRGELKDNHVWTHINETTDWRSTDRGYFTKDKYIEYEESCLTQEITCGHFILNWVNQHYSKEDYEIFSKWGCVEPITKMLYRFRPDDWEWMVEKYVERELETVRNAETFPKSVQDTLRKMRGY